MAIQGNCFLFVVTRRRFSGIERDDVVNTFHYLGPSGAPTSPQFGAWANHWKGFMDLFSPAYGSPCMGLGPEDVNITAWHLPVNQGPLGAPVAILNTQVSNNSSSPPLPSEVAMCITLESDTAGQPEHGPGGTRPASRRRNRKYLGPLATNIVAQDLGTKEAIIGATVGPQVAGWYITHMIENMVTDGWVAVTHSKVAWDAQPVLRVKIDDAFDTQRRRGNDPLLKTTDPVGAETREAMRALSRSE